MAEQCEKHGLINGAQYGSREKRQTTQPLNLLLDLIENANRTGQPLHIASLDYRQAFDSVPFRCVEDGLRRAGFSEKVVTMYSNMMKGRTCSFITGYGDTEPIPVNSSVIQGSVLGPLLYLLALDGLLEKMNQFKGVTVPRTHGCKNFGTIAALQYVDDTILLAESKEELEAMVSRNCKQWQRPWECSLTKPKPCTQ